MGWVRVSDDFYDHPKFDTVGPLGIAMWIAGLAWCNRNLSDGVIPRSAVVRLLDWEGVGDVLGKAASRNGGSNGVTNAPRNSDVAAEVAQLLVDAGLWMPTESGYEVLGYLKYQRSADQIKAEAKGNAARQARWRETHRTGLGNEARNGVTNAEVTGAPNPNPNPNIEKKTSSSSDVKPKKPSARGTRVPEPFVVDAGMKSWFAETCPGVNGSHEHQKFMNYWRGVAGAKGLKLDWPATWKNWMLTAFERLPSQPAAVNGRGRPSTPSVGRNHSQ
jgi:hypothetical protein